VNRYALSLTDLSILHNRQTAKTPRAARKSTGADRDRLGTSISPKILQVADHGSHRTEEYL
jgi:hypothetical protein